MTVDVKMRRNAEILFEELGQRRSIAEQRAVDRNGDPIPWYTYPFIEYIASLKPDDLAMFEYGCGHSSLYWAGRARSVTSVDHDPQWFGIVKAKAPANLTLLLHQEEREYVQAIAEAQTTYDIIVIDGRWRRQCTEIAPAHLAPGGMIIFDNSDWYPGSCAILRNSGFFQCDFSGFGPVNNYTWTTSLFVEANTRLQRGFANPAPVGSIRQALDGIDFN